MRRIAALEFRPRRVVPKYWWVIGIGAFAIALAAVATSPASRDAAAQAQCPFTIDFAGLPHGTILGEQYAAQGVHISAVANASGADALIVFNTDLPPTHDDDLAIDIGNIAVIALNTTDLTGPPNNEGPPDGLVDDPDENNEGGIATFTFDHDVSIGSVKWIDKDHVADNFVIAYNAAGDVITSVPVPLGANSSVQTIPINADGVRRLVFDYDESGGFTGIEVDCEQATATPTATSTQETPGPTPTPGATPTPAPTDTPAPTPSPTVAAGTPTPGPSPSQSPTVAAAVSPPEGGTSVSAGPGALPAGGGTPSPEFSSGWAAALAALALVLGGTAFARRRRSG